MAPESLEKRRRPKQRRQRKLLAQAQPAGIMVGVVTATAMAMTCGMCSVEKGATLGRRGKWLGLVGGVEGVAYILPRCPIARRCRPSVGASHTDTRCGDSKVRGGRLLELDWAGYCACRAQWHSDSISTFYFLFSLLFLFCITLTSK